MKFPCMIQHHTPDFYLIPLLLFYFLFVTPFPADPRAMAMLIDAYYWVTGFVRYLCH